MIFIIWLLPKAVTILITFIGARVFMDTLSVAFYVFALSALARQISLDSNFPIANSYPSVGVNLLLQK